MPSALRKPSTHTQEVVAALDVVIALAHSGVCAAYDQGAGRWGGVEGAWREREGLLYLPVVSTPGAPPTPAPSVAHACTSYQPLCGPPPE